MWVWLPLFGFLPCCITKFYFDTEFNFCYFSRPVQSWDLPAHLGIDPKIYVTLHMENLVLNNTFFHVWMWMCVVCSVVHRVLWGYVQKKKEEEEEVILDLLLSEAIHSQDTGAIKFSLLPIIFTSIVFNFHRPLLNFPTEFCKFSCFVSLLMCIFLQLTQSQECKAER